jgi:hypothetical protein
MGFLKISTSLHKRLAAETYLADAEFQVTVNGIITMMMMMIVRIVIKCDVGFV